MAAIVKNYDKYFRLLMLIHHGGLKVCREILHDSRYNGLPKNETDLYEELKNRFPKKVKLFPDQEAILFPKDKKTNVMLFDISLITKVILSCLNLPRSIEIWLQELKDSRNELSHCGQDLRMSDVEFQKKWDRLKKLLSGLGLDVSSVVDLETCSLDATMKYQVTYIQLNVCLLTDRDKSKRIHILQRSIQFAIKAISKYTESAKDIGNCVRDLIKVFDEKTANFEARMNNLLVELKSIRDEYGKQLEHSEQGVEDNQEETQKLKEKNKQVKRWIMKFHCNEFFLKKTINSRSSQKIRSQARKLLNKELEVMQLIKMSTRISFGGDIEPWCDYSIRITSRVNPLPEYFKDSMSPESVRLRQSLTNVFKKQLCQNLGKSFSKVTIECVGWEFGSVNIFFSMHFSQNILEHCAPVSNILSSALLKTSVQEVLALNGLEGCDIDIKFESNLNMSMESLLVGLTIHLYDDVKCDVGSILLNCEREHKDIISQELVKLPATQHEKASSNEKTIKPSKEWDIMMSYQWSTGGKYVDMLEPMLIKEGYKVWRDKNEVAGTLGQAMAEGVADSNLILLFISKKYENSKNCQKEYNLANSLNKKIIPVLVENYKPADNSVLRLIMGDRMYYPLYRDLEDNLKNLMRDIRKQVPKSDGLDRKIPSLDLTTSNVGLFVTSSSSKSAESSSAAEPSDGIAERNETDGLFSKEDTVSVEDDIIEMLARKFSKMRLTEEEEKAPVGDLKLSRLENILRNSPPEVNIMAHCILLEEDLVNLSLSLAEGGNEASEFIKALYSRKANETIDNSKVHKKLTKTLDVLNKLDDTTQNFGDLLPEHLMEIARTLQREPSSTLSDWKYLAECYDMHDMHQDILTFRVRLPIKLIL